MSKIQRKAYGVIKKLTILRFAYASSLCYLLVLQLLWGFLIYAWIDSSYYCGYIKLFVYDVVLSAAAYKSVLSLMPFVTAYGLLLYKMEYRILPCHRRWYEKIQAELGLLCLLVGWSYCNTWIYLAYMDILTVNMNVDLNKYYFLLNAAICSCHYFWLEHRQGNHEQRHLCQPVQASCVCFGLVNGHVSTIMTAIIYWPEMNGGYLVDWNVLWQAWSLATLLLIQFYSVKKIYAHFMLIQMRFKSKFPIFLALNNKFPYGFQMQGANAFAHLANRGKWIKELFEPPVNVGPKRWNYLRDRLFNRIYIFIDKLKRYQNDGSSNEMCIQILPNDQQLDSSDVAPDSWFNLNGKWKQFIDYCHKYLSQVKDRYFEAKSEHLELCSDKPLINLLNGLNSIINCGPNEPRYGLIHKDTQRFWKAFSNMESILDKIYAKHLHDEHDICATLLQLRSTVKLSKYILENRFMPKLNGPNYIRGFFGDRSVTCSECTCLHLWHYENVAPNKFVVIH